MNKWKKPWKLHGKLFKWYLHWEGIDFHSQWLFASWRLEGGLRCLIWLGPFLTITVTPFCIRGEYQARKGSCVHQCNCKFDGNIEPKMTWHLNQLIISAKVKTTTNTGKWQNLRLNYIWKWILIWVTAWPHVQFPAKQCIQYSLKRKLKFSFLLISTPNNC